MTHCPAPNTVGAAGTSGGAHVAATVPSGDDLLLTAPEAARLLRVSRRHLLRLATLPDPPPRIRIGRRVLYPRADVLAWALRRSVEGGDRAA